MNKQPTSDLADFCIFILTNGRPDKIFTYNALRRQGYTGKIYFVLDDEDPTESEYRLRFGTENVITFCKAAWQVKTDEYDNFQHRKSIVYARNACWELATRVGCRYFMQLEDDYMGFQYRVDRNHQYTTIDVQDMNALLSALLRYYKTAPIKSLAMSQGGDHLSGAGSSPETAASKQRLKRKIMNSWICDTKRPIEYLGHMNDDTTTYVTYGRRGDLFFTVQQVMLIHRPTQTTPGLLTELYLSAGTYVKSFYTILSAPSCTQIGVMGVAGNRRIHHKINWNATVPKIIREEHRKPSHTEPQPSTPAPSKQTKRSAKSGKK